LNSFAPYVAFSGDGDDTEERDDDVSSGVRI
jgi:hypothetical protein